MIKTGVRLHLQESKELPRGEKMTAKVGRKRLSHQVHFTLATRVLAGPKPITSSTLPDWNQNKTTFEFTTAHLSLLASLKPSHTSLNRAVPLMASWPSTQSGFAFASSAYLKCLSHD